MIKIIPSGSYDFDEPALQLVKFSRYGLGPNDAKDLLKRASGSFVERIARMERLPGEELAHNIALGATEYFGPNRNGDGFKEAECRKNHGTFVTHGRAYRDHKNADPAKSYGVVKLSHYNSDQHRIELAVAYNATKEAAERNGGLVADLELDDLEKKGEFPASMATRLAFDVCSSCGNRAKSRKEYCDGSMCKHGGLKRNIGRTFADGHTLHADNPENTWFDMSRVKRGADRTCYTLGLVEKAAHAVKCGAELAEEYGLVDAARAYEQSGFLVGFAKAASDLQGAPSPGDARSAAFGPAVQGPLSDAPDVRSRPEKFASVLRALADARVVLSPGAFFGLVLGDQAAAGRAARDVGPLLKRAYAAVLGDEELLASNPYLPARGPASTIESAWALKTAEDYGLAPGLVARRAALASIRGAAAPTINVNRRLPLLKSARAADELARHYALYKIAALAHMAGDPLYPRLVEAAVLQDRVGV